MQVYHVWISPQMIVLHLSQVCFTLLLFSLEKRCSSTILKFGSSSSGSFKGTKYRSKNRITIKVIWIRWLQIWTVWIFGSYHMIAPKAVKTMYMKGKSCCMTHIKTNSLGNYPTVSITASQDRLQSSTLQGQIWRKVWGDDYIRHIGAQM